MRFVKTLTVAASCLAFGTGCSQNTKTETKEALHQAGEAVSSAAQDTKENAAKAADALEDAAHKTREKLSGETTEPAPSTAPAPAPTSP